MPKNYYRDAIEALGMRSDTSVVLNRLNAVVARAKDEQLRKLAAKTIDELRRKSTNTKIVPVKDMSAVPTARRLNEYCEAMIKLTCT